MRRARAGVDMGNQVLILAEPLARDLGLDIRALRGAPGATRSLVLEREGRRVTVAAKVARLP